VEHCDADDSIAYRATTRHTRHHAQRGARLLTTPARPSDAPLLPQGGEQLAPANPHRRCPCIGEPAKDGDHAPPQHGVTDREVGQRLHRGGADDPAVVLEILEEDPFSRDAFSTASAARIRTTGSATSIASTASANRIGSTAIDRATAFAPPSERRSPPISATRPV
jgi:hypothetical protein